MIMQTIKTALSNKCIFGEYIEIEEHQFPLLEGIMLRYTLECIGMKPHAQFFDR